MIFFRRHPWAVRIALYGASAVFSALSFHYLLWNNFVNAFGDAQSHLLQSTQMVHSLTPGISQLGFWPPLLHVVLLPAVIVLPHPVLLAAGSFLTMLPLLLLGAYFLYGICRLSDVSPRISVLAPTLFVLHPFIQYFTSSAMAELPLIVFVLASTYFALRWSRSSSLWDLSLFGISVSIASTARYEGVTLIPLSLAFVVIRCLSLKLPWQQMKAIIETFMFVAVLGMFFIMLYSTVYSGTPLGFLALGTERVGAQQGRVSLGRFDKLSVAFVSEVFYRFFLSSLHMHGAWLMAAFVISVVIVVLLRRKWQDIATIMLLMSPALFVLSMMSIGRIAISVPELPRTGMEGAPYGYFYNTRFALTWVGAMIIPIVLAIDALIQRRFLSWVAKIFVVPAVLLSSAAWFSTVVFGSNLEAVRLDEQALERFKQVSDQTSFLPGYDGGRVLMTRFYAEGIMLSADIPLERFVYEGNYRYFDQAVREPWLFVRWVIVRHTMPDPRGASVTDTKIFRQMLDMEAMPEFQRYFDLIQATPEFRYYRLRSNLLGKQAQALGYDVTKIPSLNPDARWNPKTFYEDLQAGSTR